MSGDIRVGLYQDDNDLKDGNRKRDDNEHSQRPDCNSNDEQRFIAVISLAIG